MTKIIGYHINKEGIFSSEGKSITNPSFLEFLMDGEEDTIRVFSDLDNCVAGLAYLIKMTRKEADSLLNSKKKMVHFFDCGIGLQYYPGKSFAVTKGWYPNLLKHARYSDASQYSEELKHLAIEGEGFACANLAKQVGEEAYTAFEELGYNPKSLTSPVSVFKKSVYRTLDLPTRDDVPREANWLAYQSCKGGWFEAYKTGHFPLVYDYDINSAYPSVALNLYDIRKGRWVCSSNPRHIIQATYGYLEVDIDIVSPFSPVIYQRDASDLERNYTPTGQFSTFITLEMARYILQQNLGAFTIKNGYFFYKDADAKLLPFQEIIEELYAMRQKSTSEMKRSIAKTIMVGGFYGLFLQQMDDYIPKNFIPVYASEIQTNVQIAMHKVCVDNNIIPLANMVDGLVTDKPLDLKAGKNIGEWKLNTQGRALIVSSGVMAIQGKKGSGEYSLDYDWMINYAKQHPTDNCFKLKKNHVISLPLAFHYNELTSVGNIEPEERRIFIEDLKRVFPTMPSNLDELISQQFESHSYDAALLMSQHDLEENECYRKEVIDNECLPVSVMS